MRWLLTLLISLAPLPRAATAVLLVALLPCAASGMAAEVPKQVRACADTNDFPPYTYRSRASGRRDVEGFNADYLDELLAPLGRTLHIAQLPWKRCLADTMAGKFDIVLDVAGTPERQRQFHLARSHYSVTPIILFDRRHPPPPLSSPKELAQLTRCEVLGWDYSGAGLAAASVPQSAPTTAAGALTMLRNGRCQVMVYDMELLRGLQLTGDDALVEGFGYAPLPWVPSYRMHVGVSRAVPYAWDLLRMLDNGVERMAGARTRILARHIPR